MDTVEKFKILGGLSSFLAAMYTVICILVTTMEEDAGTLSEVFISGMPHLFALFLCGLLITIGISFFESI